jgi:hypothetical protein
MLNLFQHAVTIVFFCFFCSARLASKITRFCSYFYQCRHDINKNMILLAPPSQEGMGEASLAPQGAAPAPPLQGGVGKASLAPQGTAPAPPSHEGMGEASLAPQGTPPAPPLHEGMGEAYLAPQGTPPAPPLQGSDPLITSQQSTKRGAIDTVRRQRVAAWAAKAAAGAAGVAAAERRWQRRRQTTAGLL